MRWIVRVARTMDDVKECYFTTFLIGTTKKKMISKKWIEDIEDEPIKILVNMHQFGYEVEKEPRYTVRIKGVDGYATHLNENLDNHEWFFASDDEIKGYRIKHTRKELEANGFGWVFNCEGIEVKEVE